MPQLGKQTQPGGNLLLIWQARPARAPYVPGGDLHEGLQSSVGAGFGCYGGAWLRSRLHKLPGAGCDCASRWAGSVLVRCAEGFEPARIGLDMRLEGDAPRLEGLGMVHELLGRLAKLLIIVKTLNRTRAIKGFYYDEKGCRLTTHLVNAATHLDTGAIDVCTRATINCSLLIDDCRPDERLCRPAMSLVRPREAFDTPSTHLATPSGMAAAAVVSASRVSVWRRGSRRR